MKSLLLIEKELRELNDRFHQGNLLNKELMKQISDARIDPKRSILVELFPDGGSTYVGKLIDQNLAVHKFDLDSDDFSYSSWEDITKQFLEMVERPGTKQTKEKIAYELAKKLQYEAGN